MLLKAIVLNDYSGEYYATWMKEGKKKIETRMNRTFSYKGDIVICCGLKSVTENAGKALCIVEIWKTRPMKKEDAEAACIDWHPQRISYLLRNWRYFSEDFEYKKLKMGGSWQSIFDLMIPDHIEIIPQPGILPFPESQISLMFD